MRTLLIFSLAAIICLISNSSFAQSISISATHDTICAGTSVTFSATASGTATPHYQWYKNSASVGTDSTGYTTSSLNNGDIIECLLSSSVGGPTIALSSGIVMVVYHMPVVSTITGTDSVCRGTAIILTDDSLGGSWTSTNTAIAGVNALGHAGGVAVGTDTIIYTITNICGTASDSFTLRVVTTPVVDPIVGPVDLCAGTPSTLYIDSTLMGTWGSSNMTRATVDTLGNVTPLVPGAVNITYALTNGCGTTTRTRAVTVLPVPVTGPIMSSTNTICQTDTLHLHDMPAGGIWMSSNTNIINIGGNGVLVTSLEGGTDTITYIVANQCGIDSSSIVITVNPLPVVYPIVGNDSLCPGVQDSLTDFTTGGTWTSSNPSAATIDATGLLTTVAGGTSTITYSVTNSCGTTTESLEVAVYCPLAVNNVVVQNSNISIFPNPANDIVYVKGFNPTLIRVVNMYGQTVKYAQSANSIEVSELPAGIYFVQLFNANGVIVDNQRLLKF